jgi:S-adenosylmethionine-diacylglycerol 3-amino-3-carboxypropyl transferase
LSVTYFNNLNYTLANEDTSLEIGILPESASHIVTVAGSGGRAVPLLAKRPHKLSCVDLSREQLLLTELRIEALRALSHADYLRFWGYPPRPAEPDERRRLFGSIRLSADAVALLEQLFDSVGWESILYMGKWEKTFARLSAVIRRATGQKGIDLFSALTRCEHERYLRERFPTYAWAVMLTLLGNAWVFNSLLYRGHFPKKNIPMSSYRYYREGFRRLLDQGPARENFFLQVIFFGRILFAEGCPIECDPSVYRNAKESLRAAEIRYLQGNVIEVIAGMPARSVDFVSLSDVPSYFSGEIERNFLQRIRPAITPGGRVVVRNYLHIPEGADRTGFTNVADRYAALILREKVQNYLVDVFEKNAEAAG